MSLENLKISILFLFLLGCKATEKTYKKVATDYNVTTEKKAIIAPWVSVHFPPTTEFIFGKSDTLIETVYDEQALSELNEIIDSLLLMPKDSVVKYLQNYVPKVQKIYVHRTDTLLQEDAGAVFSLKQQLVICDHDVNVKVAELKTMEERLEKMRGVRNKLIGVLSLIGFGIIVFFLAKLRARV